MGLDRNNIPDEYLCEVCKPRAVDRKRARALQSRRRTEIFPSSSDNDDAPAEGAKLSKKKVSGKKIQNRKPDLVHPHAHAKGKVKVSGKLKLGGKLKERSAGLSSSKEDRKKQRKRKPSEKGGADKRPNKKVSGRRPSYDDDDDGFDDEDDEGDSESTLLEPRLEDSQQLRSWIDQYEEAVTNHYSPELRARLAGSKLSNVSSDLRPSAIGGPSKCIVSLKGNGVKVRSHIGLAFV